MTGKLAILAGQDLILRITAAAALAADADRQQIGARVTRSTYRQLQARAELAGVTVQTLVERAIDEFLAKSRNDTPISDDFVQAFKARAVQDRLKLNELLEKSFAAYCAKTK
jgi:hypothetical protein